MPPHAELIDRLYSHPKAHQPQEMAHCYHPDATFEDIAFRLKGRDAIHAMWRLVTQPATNLDVSWEVLSADDSSARARVIDDYIFSDTKKPVHNVIESRFAFKDGLIIEHRDDCDPVAWANMALNPPKSWAAGRFRFLRAAAAKKKLQPYLDGKK